VTRDGGETWSTQHNQPTSELYLADVDDRFPYWVYAGQQDNSTIAVPSLPTVSLPGGATASWRAVGGCETGPAVPKPGDPTIVYANCKGRFGRYSTITGQEQQFYVGAANMYGHNPADLTYRFQRVSPIEISPHDPDVIYHGSQFVHVTRDGGRTWETISPDLTAFESERQVVSGGPITRDITGEEFYSTLYAIEESPLEPGVIWTGANDGPIHVTRDGGATWTDVTPPDLPSGGRVQNIDPSPHDPARAYVAVYRYLLGDWEPYAYRTTDYGRSWTRLTTGENGIPGDYPVRVVREDPDRAGLLYAGTEFGMFVSFDDGAQWEPFQLNLPVTPITDVRVYRKDLVLSTMGRSFWILDNLTPLHQYGDDVRAAPSHLFEPRMAYRMRYTSWRRNPSDPEYPPPGAAIDYYLAQPVSADMHLEITDASGSPIRSYDAGTAPQTEGEDREQGMRGPTSRGRPAARLERAQGMHRLVWDLQHAGAIDPATGRSRGSGPMAVPGTYRIRLRIGDWSQERSLELRLDPRVAADGVTQQDLVRQLDLSLDVQRLLEAAWTTLAEINRRIEEAADGPDAAAGLRALRSELVTAEDMAYPQPMLLDQIRYLYGMLTGADQPPGNEAYARYAELEAWLERIRGSVGD
jgi:hypothetical protein